MMIKSVANCVMLKEIINYNDVQIKVNRKFSQ
jgi:hypothetical protein